MRLRQGALVAVLSLTLTRAEADTLKRILDAGDDAGGGPPPNASGLAAWAGPSRATTLPDLLQVTVRQSPALRNARYDIAIAEARIQQTWVRNDWLFRGQLQGSKTTSLFSGFSIDSTDILGTFDITHTIATGGTLGLHAGSEYSKSKNQLGDSTTWRHDVSVNFTQPILRGAGADYFNAGERKATLARDSAVLAKRLAAIQAVQAVVSAYWDLVLAERQVAITQSALDLAKERLRITQIGADVGKLPRSEIPAVQQIIATREEDILNSEFAVLDRSIALRRTTGLPIGAGELGLRVDPDLAMRDVTWNLAELTERAFAASPELAQLAKADASTHIDIEVTENGLLPQLDAALSFGPIGQDTDVATAAENLVKFKSIGVGGSLTFTQGLRRDDVRGRQREFRENLHKLEVNQFDIRAQIAQTMGRAVAGLELAKRRVALSQRAIDLANDNIKIETDRFNLGKATNFDVLNRQEELRQAELRKVQAMIDWHKSEVVVQALTGDILPTYGVTVE
jgi:outer membrane protein